MTSSYFWSFFVGGTCGLASVRAGNVVGGGDWSRDRLLPDLVAAFAADRAAIVRRPDAVRPWQHVLEPLAGYLVVAERLHGGGQTQPAAWNFGPDAAHGVPVDAIADMARCAWGDGAAVEIRPEANAPHEATLLTLDASKARVDLGWRPSWDVAATVSATVEWYRGFYAGGSARELCVDQIRRYRASRDISSEHTA